MILFPVNIFPNTKGPKVRNNLPRDLPACFFLFRFLLFHKLHAYSTPEFSSDCMIQILSSKSSFKMTKVTPFPVLSTLLPHIFL